MKSSSTSLKTNVSSLEVELPTKTLEALDESLKEIKAAVDEIADVLFKGNGNSVTSRVAMLEKSVAVNTSDLDKQRIVVHDLKTRITVGELKHQLQEQKAEKGDGKSWNVVTIVLSIGLSLLAQFLFK